MRKDERLLVIVTGRGDTIDELRKDDLMTGEWESWLDPCTTYSFSTARGERDSETLVTLLKIRKHRLYAFFLVLAQAYSLLLHHWGLLVNHRRKRPA